MRTEQIKHKAEIETLHREKTELRNASDKARLSGQDEIGNAENKIRELETEVLGLKERIKVKEEQLSAAERRYETVIESEKQLKEQLSKEFARVQTANNENYSLKGTLVDSQQEMDNVVSKYD